MVLLEEPEIGNQSRESTTKVDDKSEDSDGFELVPNMMEDFEMLDGDEVDLPKLGQDAAFNDMIRLEAMGFVNRDKNLDLLEKHKGDLLKCVEELLEEGSLGEW